MEINDNLKKWLERVGNSNSNNNLNVNDYRVITQAFRFVKLDSHLAFLISQVSYYRSSCFCFRKKNSRVLKMFEFPLFMIIYS